MSEHGDVTGGASRSRFQAGLTRLGLRAGDALRISAHTGAETLPAPRRVSATDTLGCTGSQTYTMQILGGGTPVAAPALSLSGLMLLGLLVCAYGLLRLRQRRT